MGADVLLSRIDGARQTGPDRWIARCPAHDDRLPSLAIRELDDGRVLIHCFAGCAVQDVLDAAGLDFQALFAQAPVGGGKRLRRPFSALQALHCIAFEATLAAIAASSLARGVELKEDERARLQVAAGRINHALEITLGP